MHEPDRRNRRYPYGIAALVLRGCAVRLFGFLVLAVAVSFAGAAVFEGVVVAVRHGWRLAFAPWSYDAPGRPALLGLWRGPVDIEGDPRTVVLDLDYRYTGDESETHDRANVAGWLTLCSTGHGTTSAYAIEAAIGSKPSEEILLSIDETIVADPNYLFHARFRWTGNEIKIALPFSRRVGTAAVSSTRDPLPTAALHRIGGPTARGPGCD
jgi:hypothetical protein